MASLEHYYTRFGEGGIYHVYNRSIDRQPLFRNADNYAFFLRRLEFYLTPVADIYAYCLLGNHFHLCIRIKPLAEMGPLTTRTREHACASAPAPAPDLTTFTKLSNLVKNDPAFTTADPHDIVSHQFRKLFQSYAMAFNKQHARIGTLFQTPFKRALVNDEAYFRSLVLYIHQNPQHHELTTNYRDWKWSSFYSLMIRRKKGIVNTSAALELLGGMDEFVHLHQNEQPIYLHHG